MTQSLISPTEAATLLGISRRTLDGWRHRGGGPRYHKLSPGRAGRVRYALEDIDAWLAERGGASTTLPHALVPPHGGQTGPLRHTTEGGGA